MHLSVNKTTVFSVQLRQNQLQYDVVRLLRHVAGIRDPINDEN